MSSFYDYLKAFEILFTNYYYEKKIYFNKIIKISEETKFLCEHKKFRKFGIYALIIFFIITVIWLIYDIIKNTYSYFQQTAYFYFKNDKRLKDSPLFKQINNIYYFNDFFSIDYMFLLFISTPLFVLAKIYLFEQISGEKGKFYYTQVLNWVILIAGIIYFIFAYRNLANLGFKMNNINKLIYNNINNDFIYNQGFCNYINKKNEYDYDFIYGKCNNLTKNIGITKLYNYIRNNILDIGQTVAPISNISVSSFKKLKDKNGVLYKDKIISAFFTYQLMKYYIDNDLEDEAKDFFSAFNLIYLKNSGTFLKNRINPILYLRFNDIMLFNKILEYNSEMEDSFGGNKEIYNYIYREYNIIQSNVQDLVVDIYNICSYKLISVYMYYLFIFVIFLILVILYVYYHL